MLDIATCMEKRSGQKSNVAVCDMLLYPMSLYPKFAVYPMLLYPKFAVYPMSLYPKFAVYPMSLYLECAVVTPARHCHALVNLILCGQSHY